MTTLLTVLIIIVAVLLILVVLIQDSKGGGLASNFSNSNQMMGVKKTTETIEKATWGLAISLLVLCVVTSFFVVGHTGTMQKSRTADEFEEFYDPNTAPVVGSENIPVEMPDEENNNSENE